MNALNDWNVYLNIIISTVASSLLRKPGVEFTEDIIRKQLDEHISTLVGSNIFYLARLNIFGTLSFNICQDRIGKTQSYFPRTIVSLNSL